MSRSGLRLELRGSPALAGLVVVSHGLAAGVLLAFLPPAQGTLGALLLLVLAAHGVRTSALLLAPGSPRALRPGPDAVMAVGLRSGEEVSGAVLERRFVSRWLVIVDLAGAGGRRTILVARDMLDPEAFRRLRLWALWGTLPAGGAKLPA